MAFNGTLCLLFIGAANFSMLSNFKEKSWIVMLVKGYVQNNHVRAKRCENCKSTSEALTLNFNKHNLLLYGCKDSKCKHRLMRLDFNAGAEQMLVASIENEQANRISS
jgi:hypothetical protein